MTPDNIEMKRECGSCTLCCEGHLQANIHGIPMLKGRPCHFFGECEKGGCTIYEQRPQLCKDYQCLWKITPTLPEWMKPNKSDVIMGYVQEDVDGETIDYITMRECNNNVRSDVLNYVIRTTIEHGMNLEYECCGGLFHLGDEKWIRHHVEAIGGTIVNDVPVEEASPGS